MWHFGWIPIFFLHQTNVFLRTISCGQFLWYLCSFITFLHFTNKEILTLDSYTESKQQQSFRSSNLTIMNHSGIHTLCLFWNVIKTANGKQQHHRGEQRESPADIFKSGRDQNEQQSFAFQTHTQPFNCCDWHAEVQGQTQDSPECTSANVEVLAKERGDTRGKETALFQQ